MRRTILAVLAVLALAACGDETRGQCPEQQSVPTCDWETQLWDGTTCLLRTDHEGHLGHSG